MESAEHSVPAQNVEQPSKTTTWRLFIFWMANIFLMLLYDAFWLLGYQIRALDELSAYLGYSVYVIWFLGFFFASILSLGSVLKQQAVIKCLGIALIFSFVTYWFLVMSTILLGPFIDPHW
jgi:hypothetical protein